MSYAQIQRTSTHARRGFTLIELLVVMTIILMLMALVAVVSRILAQGAAATECMSNIRQQGMMFGLFAADYRGSIPGETNDSTVGFRPSYYRDGDPIIADMNGWWQGYLWPYLSEATGMASTNVGSNIDRKGAARVFMCPDAFADEEVITETIAAAGGSLTGGLRVWVSTSYAMNGNLCVRLLENGGSTVHASYRPFSSNHAYRLNVVRSDVLPLMAEISGVDRNGRAKGALRPQTPCNLDGDVFYGSKTFNNRGSDDINAYAIRANHRDLSNILFFDLHVERKDPASLCNGNKCTGTGNGSVREAAPHPWVGYF